MKLSRLIRSCDVLSQSLSAWDASHDPDVLSVVSDSRRVGFGSLFIAIRGFKTDGHDFMKQALQKGAVAILAESNPENLDNVILVPKSRPAAARVAAEFYGHPSEDLVLVGITGTNGKTTTTWILESIFKEAGFTVGVIGTVNIRYRNRIIQNPVTTPDAIDLQQILHEMKTAGVTHVIMEVSSHGLDLNRVDTCMFDAGVFTNLTQDHLDYHESLDAYFNCKKRFFTDFLGPGGKNNAPAVLNIDHETGSLLSRTLDGPTFTVGTRPPADMISMDVTDDIHGLSGSLCLKNRSIPFSSPLTGRFNLENILCAAGAAQVLNIDPEAIRKGIENCRSIPGRLEKIRHPLDRFMFVDYAHTPDALNSILTTLKKRTPNRLITIFGCGGDRDRSKRPIMGSVVARHSDLAIVTSDNPRTEDPDVIIRDILKGMDETRRLSMEDLARPPFKTGFLVEPDREKALNLAVHLSRTGDIIVAAGKGHETYQITRERTLHFDDREQLGKAADRFLEQFTPIAWSTDDLSRALNLSPRLVPGDGNLFFTGISTDSRTIRDTDVFVALRGDRFDGHSFVPRLIDRGVRGFVIEPACFADIENHLTGLQKSSLLIFETDSTLTALADLARYQKIRSRVKLLAITGSSGKTTTRQITENIFKTRFHTLATHGNLNNEIGVPMTLLNLSAAHQWAVVEMGMNHPGEISRLSRMAQPDMAMVLNTAEVHLQGLGSVENVALAKAEIFEGVQGEGIAIVNGDDPRRLILSSKARGNPLIKTHLCFGSGADADVRVLETLPRDSGIEFFVATPNGADKFTIPSPAPFMVSNALAAICAAQAAGIDAKGIQQGLNAFNPLPGRMHPYSLTSTLILIDDTYNANPASVTAALNTLKRMSGPDKCVAVLGDMLELGERSSELHRAIGQTAVRAGVTQLYGFGDQARHIVEGAVEAGLARDNTFHGSREDIARRILDQTHEKTWILVKGSRGMAMEKVIQELKALIADHEKKSERA